MYGVLERQFRRYFAEAERRKGNTGANLLMLLESRLDNVVYRMGFGSTRAEARQLVSHKGITVNGEVVNIPSSWSRPATPSRCARRPRSSCASPSAVKLAGSAGHAWLGAGRRRTRSKASFKKAPDRDEFGADINESLIVELYSR